MKRILAALAAVLVLSMLLGSCGKQPDEVVEPEAQSLNLMWTAQIGTDTIFENPWLDMQCLYPYMVFEPLLSIDGDGTETPRLATEWTVSPDGLTYTFTITDKATWSDGEAVTAEDVAFTLWGVLACPKSSGSSKLADIKGAAAAAETAAALEGVSVDGDKVIVTLDKLNLDFLRNLATVMILPKHLLSEVSADQLGTYEDYWKKPVGCGAYVIDQVSFPDYFTLTANPSYYREAAGIPDVTFKSYATGGNDAVIAALTAGEIDYAYGNELNDYAAASGVTAANSAMKFSMMTSSYGRQLLFNTYYSADGKLNPGMADADVRRGIELCIDKDAVAQIYGDNAFAINAFIHDDNAMYNTALEPFARDVEAGKALLDGAGFDYTHPVRISYYYTDQTTLDVIALITQNLEEAGLTVESSLLSGDLGTLIYTDRNFDILLCGEAMDDPVQLYGVLLGTRAGDYFNNMLGDNEERETLFTALIEQYNAAATTEERKQIADKLQENGVAYTGLIPLVGMDTIAVYNAGKVSIPASVLSYDLKTRNWKFEDWTLVA